MTICSFFGHSDAHLSDNQLAELELHLIDLISSHGVTHFYCGFYGLFDSLCAILVRSLKTAYPHIKLCAITPYILPSYAENNAHFKNTCDELIYPEIEHVPYKFAISKRNDWMVNVSNYIVAYVDRGWGGASKCYQKAVKLGKPCTNFGCYSITQ